MAYQEFVHNLFGLGYVVNLFLCWNWCFSVSERFAAKCLGFFQFFFVSSPDCSVKQKRILVKPRQRSCFIVSFVLLIGKINGGQEGTILYIVIGLALD